MFLLNDLGHMANMAVTAIYGKNPCKSSLEPAGRFPLNLKFSIEDRGLLLFLHIMTLD